MYYESHMELQVNKTVSYIVEVLYMDRLSIILLLLKLECWSYLSRGRSAGQIYRNAVSHNSCIQMLSTTAGVQSAQTFINCR